MDIISSIFTPEVVTAIAQAILGVVGAVLSAALLAGLRYIRTKTTAEQFAFLQHAATVAVQAAEQLGMSNVVADKKAAAIDIVSHELASRGIKVTAAQLDAAIEAAVMDAFNQYKADASAEVEGF